MAPGPPWRGYLRLSLVTCPVATLPATSEAEKVRFHTLSRATGNRVHVCYVDAETGKPVDDEDQVKGYEREDGEYVMLEGGRGGLLGQLRGCRRRSSRRTCRSARRRFHHWAAEAGSLRPRISRAVNTAVTDSQPFGSCALL